MEWSSPTVMRRVRLKEMIIFPVTAGTESLGTDLVVYVCGRNFLLGKVCIRSKVMYTDVTRSPPFRQLWLQVISTMSSVERRV